jgi:hypothetical protein
MKSIGFIVNSRIPSWGAFRRGMRPHHLMTGWPDKSSPMHFMRFGWIANEVNKSGAVRYELFRSWRSYDAVVFLKSMEFECADLGSELKNSGTAVVFEANVDYYTTSGNDSLPSELVPLESQRESAIRMTKIANKVIASSRRLMEICREWNPRAAWVPDNIPDSWIGGAGSPVGVREGRLQLWWSGMPSKAGDLLAIEEVLRGWKNRVHLHLVTGDLHAACQRMSQEPREALQKLLAEVPHTLHRFRDIPSLLQNYRAGGFILSPRQLGNPYNQSHTEWKITLGMAAGLPALASPQPSYRDVADRSSHPEAVTLCEKQADWDHAFAVAMSNKDYAEKSAAAVDVVRRFYSTTVVARQHCREILEVVSA